MFGYVRNRWLRAGALVVLLATFISVLLLRSQTAFADSDNALMSAWHESQYARARVIAGSVEGSRGQQKNYAGVQLELQPSWKTYWRNPGDAGGIPPTISWSNSENVRNVVVLYPAPQRLESSYGDNIGYQSSIVFPLRFERVNPDQATKLNIEFNYGICRDICIPSESKLSVDIPSSNLPAAPKALLRAINDVPRRVPNLQDGDPKIERTSIDLKSSSPHIAFDILIPGDGIYGDVFVEGPAGAYVPMAKFSKNLENGLRRFIVDLSKDVDLSEIVGRNLRVTIVGDRGQSEFTVAVK